MNAAAVEYNGEKFKFGGKWFTVETYMQQTGIQDQALAIESIKALINQGRAVVEKQSMDKFTKQLDRAAKADEKLAEKVQVEENIRREQEFKLNKKRAGSEVHEKIEIGFGNIYAAQSFANNLDDLQLEMEIVDPGTGAVLLIIKNVTDFDINKIKQRYALVSGTNTVVGAVNKVIQGTADTVDNAARYVINPVANATIKSSLSVLRTATRTAMQTGANLITHSVDNTIKLNQELKYDPDMLRAKGSLQQVANGLRKGMTKFSGYNSAADNFTVVG